MSPRALSVSVSEAGGGTPSSQKKKKVVVSSRKGDMNPSSSSSLKKKKQSSSKKDGDSSAETLLTFEGIDDEGVPTAAAPLRPSEKKRKRKEAAAQAEVQKARQSKASQVIYVGHLPHGFYEKELQGFFSQFGTVSRVKVSRSKKTGASKHYAFVEFEHGGIADIAASAMHGYLLFERLLEVRALAPSEVHPDTFKGADKKFRAIPWSTVAAKRQNRERTEQQEADRRKRYEQRNKRRMDSISAAGISYELKQPASKKSKK